MSPEAVIGPAAVKALQDAGYALVAPKEQKRIVTMEESREASRRYAESAGFPFIEDAFARNAQHYAVADDWLVKTVLRRLLEEWEDGFQNKKTVAYYLSFAQMRERWGL